MKKGAAKLCDRRGAHSDALRVNEPLQTWTRESHGRIARQCGCTEEIMQIDSFFFFVNFVFSCLFTFNDKEDYASSVT